MDKFVKNKLFSSDLITYVMQREIKLELSTQYRLLDEASPFQIVYGKAVLLIMGYNSKSNKSKRLELMNLPMHEIFRWCLDAACDFFKHGYCPVQFISYCGMLCGIMYGFSTNQDCSIYEGFRDTIACVLDTFTLTMEFDDKGGWGNLMEVAKEVVQFYTSNIPV